MSDLNSPLKARRATPEDTARIADIYNQGIRDRVATFETEPRTVDTVRGWFEREYPIVVVEAEGEVIAWATASTYRPRACYAGNAEFSVYVDRNARGQGAGTIAMRALIDAARESGLDKLISRVFVENTGSRAMLRKVGFREVGIYERHATLDGVWRDVVIVELQLQDHGGEPYGALWQPDPDTLSLWPQLAPGTPVLVEKVPWELERDVVRYGGEIVRSEVPSPWVEVRAAWTMNDVNVAGLAFRTGDALREFFSPRHPYNAFAVHAPDGTLRGWYGNVTRTARLRWEDDGLVLSWPDLVLDLIVLPDGTPIMVDDDEIDASGYRTTEPRLVDQMFAARAELLGLLEGGFFPAR